MKVITRMLLALAILLTGIPSAFAANRELKGTVLDSADEPLIGVSVQDPASKMAVATDIDGNFTIRVPEGPVTLRFSYVGYSAKTVKVGAAENNIKVVMMEDAIALEGTVVIGYGSQKKANITGAVAAIDGKALENRPAVSVSNMLQGSVAGLNVTTSSGVPGQSAKLNVRGQTSINGGSPLVLVDGAIGDIDMVNPNDVESISVIKDASASAVYGARAAYGVILVTTKQGAAKDGQATVRFNARAGWETPTTSTDFLTSGYWSVYNVNRFWSNRAGSNYIEYNHNDMMELLARVNDKTENPDRPWVVETTRNGEKRWAYYANTDWYHEMFRDSHPTQQYNISFSGGKDRFRYFLSGGMDFKDGIMKMNTDKYHKYNMRSKLDFAVNKYIDISNNTSFYGSEYSYMGAGSVEDTFAYANRHALACYPLQNPDGSWVGTVPWQSYRVANGRHILQGAGTHRNKERKTNFANTFRLNITPVKQLTITGDFTYRFYQYRDTHRGQPFYYRVRPDEDLTPYDTGAGLNHLTEVSATRNYYSVNAFATYKDTFKDAHNVTVMAGFNYEKYDYKRVGVDVTDITSPDLDDISLHPADPTYTVQGGQNEYALEGIFGRANYDYKGKYLFEFSCRYDGTSRFGEGHRWGFFPSGSVGWRMSEENFWESLRPVWNNAKVRVSYGHLGNQQTSDLYNFFRGMSTKNFASFNFGTGNGSSSYTSIDAPKAGDLTWETAKQWDLGLDLSFFNNRLSFTGDVYVRDTDNMLTSGFELPGVYGASVPKMNIANMRTKGYELAFQWNDNFNLFGHRFNYNVGFNLSDYRSEITKFNNQDKTLTQYYEGMQMGEIWGYSLEDRFFATDEEAQKFASEVNLSKVQGGLKGGWQAGDVIFRDLDGNGEINNGIDGRIRWNGKLYDPGDAGYDEAKSHLNDTDLTTKAYDVPINTLDNHGDLRRIGNELPTLSYGITAGFQYCGFDASVFFQGTGNHYWYPHGQNYSFWGSYAYEYVSFLPADFLDKVWSVDNPDSYFPRPLGRYAWSAGPLRYKNDKYLQNIRYCRLKNITVGYTLPNKWTKKAGIDKVRLYFTGENLAYWSPLKKNSKYVDPESAFSRGRDASGWVPTKLQDDDDNTNDLNNYSYPWPKTYMFGIDITF